MKRVIIYRTNGAESGGTFTNEEVAGQWIMQGTSNNWWGLPERIVVVGSEPYTPEDVLEEIPAVMNGDEQIEPPRVRLRAQYTIEIEDLGNQLVMGQLREKRNDLLAKCDWTQLPDSPLSQEQKQAYVVYRQALRDLPAQFQNINDISEVVWPEEP